MSSLDQIREKIISPDALDVFSANKPKGTMVFTNGCFDIIHRGHIAYLSKAADLGDFLFIGLNTDASVRRLKGESRPLQDEASRALILAAMAYVDYVCLFDEDTPHNLIRTLLPDVLVKGGDYQPEKIVGYQEVVANGGIVKTIDFVNGFSSTSVIKKL